MARFSRLEVWNEVLRIGMIPIFYHPDLEVSKQIVQACRAGGARVIEYTNRGDNAYRVFSDLLAHFAQADPEAILGVGSIGDAPTAALFIASGSNYIVSSTLNPEVAKLCNRRKIPYIPGCASPTEIAQAEELGVEIVKVFPGCAIGGPEFVKAVSGPTPWTRMMPTAGVDSTEESIRSWFGAGVACVGIGANLVRKEWVQARDFAAITRRTAAVIEWIRQVRGERGSP